jgi:hypothetical protein
MFWRIGIIPLASAALAGCLTLGSKDKDSVMLWPSGPNVISLMEGTVIIDAPDGYCLEEAEASGSEAGQSLFFAACGPGYPHVVLSAVASPALTQGILDEQGTAALAGYFATDRGRQSLSRSGKPADVTVLQTAIGEGVVILELNDASASPRAGLAPGYWRAVAEVGGHLVTFAVLPFSDSDMPDETLLGLLQSFVAGSREGSMPTDETEES